MDKKESEKIAEGFFEEITGSKPNYTLLKNVSNVVCGVNFVGKYARFVQDEIPEIPEHGYHGQLNPPIHFRAELTRGFSKEQIGKFTGLEHWRNNPKGPLTHFAIYSEIYKDKDIKPSNLITKVRSTFYCYPYLENRFHKRPVKNPRDRVKEGMKNLLTGLETIMEFAARNDEQLRNRSRNPYSGGGMNHKYYDSTDKFSLRDIEFTLKFEGLDAKKPGKVSLKTNFGIVPQQENILVETMHPHEDYILPAVNYQIKKIKPFIKKL